MMTARRRHCFLWGRMCRGSRLAPAYRKQRSQNAVRSGILYPMADSGVDYRAAPAK
jgi:hypothetical protein